MTHAEESLGLPSASAMPRIVHCHGSVQLSREVGDPSRPSDEAVQGSDIAAALEAMNLAGLDEDSKTIAQRLQEMETRAIDDWMKATGVVGHLMNREERLWIRDRTGSRVIASAKPDVYYIQGEHGLVLNHKTGYLPIPPAAINFQIRTEALALWHEYPRLTRIRACTAHYRFRGEFDACDYTLEHLWQAEQELLFHLRQATHPDAPRVPSIHCRYCPALGACPEAASYAVLTTVHTGPDLMKKADVEELVRRLTKEQQAFIQQRKSMILNFLDANTDCLKALPKEDLASVGLELVPGGNVRTIPDVQKMWDALFAETAYKNPIEFSLREFQECCKAAVGVVEEKLVEKIMARDGGTKAEATAKAKKIMAPAVQMVPKSPTLKPLK